jgi:hypothetical protein
MTRNQLTSATTGRISMSFDARLIHSVALLATLSACSSAAHPTCAPKVAAGCENHGIRVIKTDGCSRGELERSLELWFGPLEVWTNGSIREGKVRPASMNRIVRFHARFSADGDVLEVKSISVPPLPDAIEDWIPILKNFSPGPIGIQCDATIEWHALCRKQP